MGTQLEAVCNLKEKKNMAATTEANNSSSSGMGAMEDWRKKSGLSCSFIIFAALNLAMVIVGGDAVYLCKIQPMIPIYLIVAGSTSLALLVARLVVARVLIPKFNKIESVGQTSETKKSNSETMDMAIKFLRTFDTVASVFSTLWLLIGSYFVYSCYDKVIHDEKEKDSDNFCDYTAYLFAFIVITIGFVSLALSIIAAVCMCAIRNNE